jgi:hypothetical protein
MAEAKNEAVEVFRQFAWNLAGTLARPPRQPPAKPAGKR